VSLSQAPSAKAPQAAGARGLAPNLHKLGALDNAGLFVLNCI
jgi:hypothetical protein